MLGCWAFRMVLISRREVIGNPSFSFSIFSLLRATISSVFLSLALYTTPYVPSSIRFRHWNSSTLRQPLKNKTRVTLKIRNVRYTVVIDSLYVTYCICELYVVRERRQPRSPFRRRSYCIPVKQADIWAALSSALQVKLVVNLGCNFPLVWLIESETEGLHLLHLLPHPRLPRCSPQSRDRTWTLGLQRNREDGTLDLLIRPSQFIMREYATLAQW